MFVFFWGDCVHSNMVKEWLNRKLGNSFVTCFQPSNQTCKSKYGYITQYQNKDRIDGINSAGDWANRILICFPCCWPLGHWLAHVGWIKQCKCMGEFWMMGPLIDKAHAHLPSAGVKNRRRMLGGDLPLGVGSIRYPGGVSSNTPGPRGEIFHPMLTEYVLFRRGKKTITLDIHIQIPTQQIFWPQKLYQNAFSGGLMAVRTQTPVSPRIPSPPPDRVGLMAEKSHPQNRIVGEFPSSGHTNGSLG